MTSVVKGRGVKIELGATYGSRVALAGVSRAMPAVVTTSSPHGLADGSAGYFDLLAGMPIDGQAAQIANGTSTTFETPGLNTSPLAPFSSGFFVPVLTWVTLGESTSYSIRPGATEFIDATTVLDRFRRPRPAIFGGGTLSMNLVAMTYPSDGMLLLESAAAARLALVVRITHPDLSVRIMRGFPSFSGEDVQQGAVGTSTAELALEGLALRIAGPYIPPPAPPSFVGDYLVTGSDYSASGDYFGN